MVQKTEGLTFFVGETPVILYDDTPIAPEDPIHLAHELGHLVLRHVRPGQVTTVNREPSSTDDPRETEANVFAARLLAPACVLWALELHKPEEIASCAVSLCSLPNFGQSAGGAVQAQQVFIFAAGEAAV